MTTMIKLYLYSIETFFHISVIDYTCIPTETVKTVTFLWVLSTALLRGDVTWLDDNVAM